jgi:hypothetical protein
MYENNFTFSTASTLSEAFRAIRSNLRVTLQVALFTMFLPQLVEEFYFGRYAGDLSTTIWNQLLNRPFEPSNPDYFAPMLTYLGRFFASSLATGILFIVGYLGLVAHFCFFEKSRRQEGSIWQILAAGLRIFFPSGLVAMVLITILTVLEGTLFPILIFVTALTAMAPVLIAVEKQGGLQAVFQSITMGYARDSKFVPRWALFFGLTGLVATCYLSLIAVFYLAKGIENLDVTAGLPRFLWSEPIPGLPFTPAFAMALTLRLAGTAAIICCLPAATVHIYFQTKRSVSLEV